MHMANEVYERDDWLERRGHGKLMMDVDGMMSE
jgi:hypothetical protein